MKRWIRGVAVAAVSAGAFWGFHPAANAQSAAKPLVVVVPQTPASLDITATRNANDTTTGQIYNEPLWSFDSKGNPGKDGLASFESSPDGKTLTFHLRKGVKFQSGDPFTAADVKFSWDREVAKQPTFTHLVINVDHTEVVDDYTFKVVFKKLDVTFLPWRDLYIVSKAYFDRVGEQQAMQHPIGTGPYKVTDYADGQHLDLERWDGYWGKKPAIARVQIRYIKEDAARVAALQAGEADMIAETPYPRVDALKKAGFKTVNVPGFPSIIMRFQLANPNTPWANLKVRQAIVHAIDADSIIKGPLHGIPNRTAFLASNEPGYDAALKPYSYDVALSRKLLAEAGYAKGFNMPIYYQSDVSGMTETITPLVIYLKQIGIQADLHPVDGTSIFDTIIKNARNANFQGVIVHAGSAANNLDPTLPLSILFDSRGSFSWYTDNRKMKDLIDEIQSQPDDAKRAAEIKSAFKMAYDDYAVMDLWNTLHVYTMKAGVTYTPPIKPNALFVQDMTQK